mmetsp:Transcript_26636/g.62988  ORF Transcript_26636/g.62988 Transcript_26636/m.62988 type:complete len:206 (-) Transcript_26636:199-816(-)
MTRTLWGAPPPTAVRASANPGRIPSPVSAAQEGSAARVFSVGPTAKVTAPRGKCSAHSAASSTPVRPPPTMRAEVEFCITEATCSFSRCRRALIDPSAVCRSSLTGPSSPPVARITKSHGYSRRGASASLRMLSMRGQEARAAASLLSGVGHPSPSSLSRMRVVCPGSTRWNCAVRGSSLEIGLTSRVCVSGSTQARKMPGVYSK